MVPHSSSERRGESKERGGYDCTSILYLESMHLMQSAMSQFIAQNSHKAKIMRNFAIYHSML